jgi:radical SAM protein with 4Fe4S-binding SPASM domain
VRMVSNGLALSKETVERIRDAGITCVAVSIDGLEATHDSVRGVTGAWRRALDGLRRVADAGLQAAAITAVNARAVRELTAMRPYLSKVGVTTWQLQPVFPWGRAAVGIMSDGRVKGCLSMPDELVEGSLREADLWDIWFRPGAFAYTREFTVGKLGANCRGCEKGEQCQGGCTAMSYTTTAEFHNDPYCFLAMQARAGGGMAVAAEARSVGRLPALRATRG